MDPHGPRDMRRCGTVLACGASAVRGLVRPRIAVIGRSARPTNDGLWGVARSATRNFRSHAHATPPSVVALPTAVGMAAVAAGLAAAVTSWWDSHNEKSAEQIAPKAAGSESLEAVAPPPVASTEEKEAVASEPPATAATTPAFEVGVMEGRDAELVRVAPIIGKTALPDDINLVIFHGGCPGVSFSFLH